MAVQQAGRSHLTVDGTGPKIHSNAVWHGHEHEHGVKGTRKAWRKLHLAVDPDSVVILASELTTELVGDETALPDLFGNIDARVDRFVADRAYDGTGVSGSVTAAFGSNVEIIFHLQRTPFPASVPSGIGISGRSPNVVEWRGRWQPATTKDHGSKLK